MKKILFVDHGFHKKTKSSDFFVALLKTQFEVERVYLDPKFGLSYDYIAPKDVNVVVLWQVDYLAPVFLNQGLPTVVIPMFDGSANMPNEHWWISSNARYISFSFNLHERIRRAKGTSLLVKYFPEVPDSKVEDFSDLRAFLWQRSPDSGIHWKFLNHILGHQISMLHLHNVADDPKLDITAYEIDTELAYPVTISTWFEEKEKFDKSIKQCNLFVAPRISEGIGMAFLEAMAHGCCVIAQDMPTHNEYIMNWCNGVLFNVVGGTGSFTIEDPATLGYWARQSIIEGRENWLNRDCDAILDYIDSATKPSVSIDRYSIRTLDRLIESYTKSYQDYLVFLKTNEHFIYELSGFGSALKLAELDSVFCNKMLDMDDSSVAERFSSLALSHLYNGICWTTERALEMFFQPSKKSLELSLVVLEIIAPPMLSEPIQFSVQVNDVTIIKSELKSGVDKACIQAIVPCIARSSEQFCIRIQCDGLTFSTGAITGAKIVGVGIKSIGIFDVENVPLKYLLALEAEVIHRFGSLEKSQQFVVWCLQTGNVLRDNKAITEFENNLSSIIAKEIIKNPKNTYPAQLETILSQCKVINSKILGDVLYHPIMSEILQSREDLQNLFDFENDIGLAGFLGWYYFQWCRENNFETFCFPEELYWMHVESQLPSVDSGHGINHIHFCIWSMRKDLQNEFDLNTITGRNNFIVWLDSHGVQEYPTLKSVFNRAYAQ